jgi:hypothetical protein
MCRVCSSVRKKKKELVMKKLIFVLTLLLFFVSPAVANINIYCVDEGGGVCGVYYSMDSSDSNRPVAFGLDIRLDNDANLSAPNDLDPNFWVFPGSIDINTAATPPEVNEYGTPVGDPCDAPSDTLPGPPDSNGMTIEMGALFAPPEANSPNAPADSQRLFTFTVDADCNVSIAENIIRGGVVYVGADGAEPNLTGCSMTLGCKYQSYTYFWKGDVAGPPWINDGAPDEKVDTYDLNVLVVAWPPNPFDICADLAGPPWINDGAPDQTIDTYDLNVIVVYWACGDTKSWTEDAPCND